MSETAGDPRLELWHALGQIVPHMESADTLGTAIATALFQMVGTGGAAVILQGTPLETKSADASFRETYYLRLVSQEAAPAPPIYLDGDRGFLAGLTNLDAPLTLTAPWPEEYAATDDDLLNLAKKSITLFPIANVEPRGTRGLPVLLCLLDVPPERAPSPAELASLASFTRVAMDLVESKIRATRQAVEFDIISRISQSLTSSLSLDDIFQQILLSVRSAIGANNISVGLIDPESQELVLENSMMGPEFSSLPPIRLKLGQGVAGWVAYSGELLNVPDPYSDPRFFSGVDSDSGFTTRSILCVPLIVDGQVIGVMEAVNKDSGNFEEADERLLTALASSAAIAIAKARLHADVLSEKGRMEAIFSTMSEGLLTVRLNGQITAVNPALSTMVGLEERELLGRFCYEAIPTSPETLANLLDRMQESRTQRETFQGACDLIRPNGSYVPVLISGGATFDTGGDVSEIVIVLSDISQILEIERMKEDFVANVTHELRTPLATILLYARLLRSGKTTGQPERESRYLEIIEQQSNQIQKLVRQILDLSRMEGKASYPRKETVHLPSMIEDLLIPLEKLAHQKGLVIETDLPAGLPNITSNREAVQLILRNLIDNAIKFTPQGKIAIVARQYEDTIAVDVRDDGIGIPPESMTYLFQRFYRTETAVEQGIGGSGLGLALVKEATEKIGGTIQVSSRASRGSTFTVTLPLGNL